MSGIYKCCPGRLVRRVTTIEERIDENARKIGPGMISVRFTCSGCGKAVGETEDQPRIDGEFSWKAVFPGEREAN